tara:strand:- start:386 stop:1231 length:846 start_codon:yes stop_codon:yes gene_type:complete
MTKEFDCETYNGVRIPKLGLGTWQLEGQNCKDAINYALDEIGCRHVDTAQAYGNEEQVGAALEESGTRREDIFLTTKVWMDNMSGDRVVPSIDESLKKLRTDYCDLILIHWPNDDVAFEETLGALKKAQEQGKTRLIGVSNYTTDQVKKVREDLGFDIAVNQCEYHPFLNQSQLIEQCREYGMMFTAYSPLARGKVMGDSTLEDLSHSYNKTPAQITLRWLYQQDNVLAIPKSSSKEHIEANFDILDFELNDQDMERIFEMRERNKRMVDPDFAPKWDVAA